MKVKAIVSSKKPFQSYKKQRDAKANAAKALEDHARALAAAGDHEAAAYAAEEARLLWEELEQMDRDQVEKKKKKMEDQLEEG